MFKEKGQLKFHNIFKPFLSLLQQNNSFFFQIGLGEGRGGVRSKRQMFLLCDYGLVITWLISWFILFHWICSMQRHELRYLTLILYLNVRTISPEDLLTKQTGSSFCWYHYFHLSWAAWQIWETWKTWNNLEFESGV